MASAVGGLTTIVQPGCTGELVEGRDPAAFADALDRVLDDPDRARELGLAAHREAQGYRWSTTAARLRRVYADLAARTPTMC